MFLVIDVKPSKDYETINPGRGGNNASFMET